MMVSQCGGRVAGAAYQIGNNCLAGKMAAMFKV
jgi:hypothetical protein